MCRRLCMFDRQSEGMIGIPSKYNFGFSSFFGCDSFVTDLSGSSSRIIVAAVVVEIVAGIEESHRRAICLYRREKFDSCHKHT